MSEYEQKVEEAKELCTWFNEHRRAVVERGDGFIVSVVYGGDSGKQRVTTAAIGEAELLADMLAHIAVGLHDEYIQQQAN